MTVLALTLALTILWTYLTALPVAYARLRLPGGYDNHAPRDQQAKLEGWARRAVAAHQNAFEALIVFAATTLVVVGTGRVSPHTPTLCAVFLVARVVFEVCYLADWHVTRSLAWLTGFIACAGLVLGALAP
jgi:uncharacterized MAPEG superfamily protein